VFKIVSIIAASLLVMAFANNKDINGKLPHNPQAGECYTRVMVPPVYETSKETVMVSPESKILKTIPAKYAYVDKEVVVRDSYEKTVVIPAKYKIVNEKVVVKEEERVLQTIPTVYKTVKQKILVKPETYGWRKGSGPIQKVDNSTGEILCYTKIPAVYKTVSERVVVKEASVREQVIPARYKNVDKRVLVAPEKIIKKVVPRQTKVVSARKLIHPAKTVDVVVHPKFKTVNKKILTRAAFSEWRPILCNTNASRSSVKKIQSKLKHYGYYKGPVDGLYGKLTSASVSNFQKKNNLASGGLTKETLNKLKVRWPSKSFSL